MCGTISNKRTLKYFETSLSVAWSPFIIMQISTTNSAFAFDNSLPPVFTLAGQALRTVCKSSLGAKEVFGTSSSQYNVTGRQLVVLTSWDFSSTQLFHPPLGTTTTHYGISKTKLLFLLSSACRSANFICCCGGNECIIFTHNLLRRTNRKMHDS